MCVCVCVCVWVCVCVLPALGEQVGRRERQRQKDWMPLRAMRGGSSCRERARKREYLRAPILGYTVGRACVRPSTVPLQVSPAGSVLSNWASGLAPFFEGYVQGSSEADPRFMTPDQQNFWTLVAGARYNSYPASTTVTMAVVRVAQRHQPSRYTRTRSGW